MEKLEFHIWDFIEMDSDIVVDLKDSLKNKIRDKIKWKIYFYANQLEIKPPRLYEYFIWKKSMIPIKTLFRLSSLIKMSKEEIETNITIVKQQHVPSKNSIKNPKFPIRISPYLTSIVSNLFFDGSVPIDGKGAFYHQKDRKIMDGFINRLNYVFGDVAYSLRLDHRGCLKCRIPRIIGEFCKYLYSVNSFGSFNARVPKKIFNLGKNHKIAFILSGILDEGSITYDGFIQFGVSNNKMMEDFRGLCIDVGLNTSKIRKRDHNWYYFYLTDYRLFHKLYRGFIDRFPLFSLGYKEERLEKAIEIKEQKVLYTKEFAEKRKELILDELMKSNSSINHLSSKLLIEPRTVRRYMYSFMNNNQVKRRKVRNEYVYFLT